MIAVSLGVVNESHERNALSLNGGDGIMRSIHMSECEPYLSDLLERYLRAETQRLLDGDARLLSPRIKADLRASFLEFRDAFPAFGRMLATRAERVSDSMPNTDKGHVRLLSLYAVIRKEQTSPTSIPTDTEEDEAEARWQLESFCHHLEDQLFPAPYPEVSAPPEEAVFRKADWSGDGLQASARQLDKGRTYLTHERPSYGRNEDAYLLPGATPSWEALLERLEKDESLPGLAARIREVFAADPVLSEYLRRQERGISSEARAFGAFDGVAHCYFSTFTAWITSRIVQAHAERWDERLDTAGLPEAMRRSLRHAERILEELKPDLAELENERPQQHSSRARSSETLLTAACFAYEHPSEPGRFYGITAADSEAYLWNRAAQRLELVSSATPHSVGENAEDGREAFSTFTVDLAPGDRLLLASDGLNKLFGLPELARLHAVYDKEGVDVPFADWILLTSTLERSFRETPLGSDGEPRQIRLDDVTVVCVET